MHGRQFTILHQYSSGKITKHYDLLICHIPCILTSSTIIIQGDFDGSFGGDSMTPYSSYDFTTKDEDNDVHDTINCAVSYPGDEQ